MPLLVSAEEPCFRDAAPGEGKALVALFTYHPARKSSPASWGPSGSWGRWALSLQATISAQDATSLPRPHTLTQRGSMGPEQVAGMTLPGESWGSAERLCSSSSRDMWHSRRSLPAPSPGVDLKSKTRPALHPQPQVCTGGDDSSDHGRGAGGAGTPQPLSQPWLPSTPLPAWVGWGCGREPSLPLRGLGASSSTTGTERGRDWVSALAPGLC